MYLERVKKATPRWPVIFTILGAITVLYFLPEITMLIQYVRESLAGIMPQPAQVPELPPLPESDNYKLAKLCVICITIVGCVKLVARRIK
jgi:hypothetical protein